MALFGDVCGEQVGISDAQAVLDDSVFDKGVTGGDAVAERFEQVVGHAVLNLSERLNCLAGGKPFVVAMCWVGTAVLQQVVRKSAGRQDVVGSEALGTGDDHRGAFRLASKRLRSISSGTQSWSRAQPA